MTEPADILHQFYTKRCSGAFMLEAAKGGGINSVNYLVRLENATAAPRYVLKGEALAEKQSPGDWQKRLERQKQVAELEPLAPQLIPADNGETGIVHAGWLWRLLAYRDGHPFPGTLGAVQSAAQGLASLHAHIRNLPGTGAISSRYDHLNKGELQQIREALNGAVGKTDFGRGALDLLENILPAITREVQTLEADASLPRGWVHRDFHPANALFSGDQLTAILDLDSLATDFRMQAAAFACSRFCSGHPPANIQQFLAAYAAIDPLTPHELTLYPRFVQREALRRINWILRVNLLEERDLWRGDLGKQTAILLSAKT